MGRTGGFEQLTRRAIRMVQGRPDALVHLVHPIVDGDEPNAKFVFHGRPEEYTVNLDRPGPPHRYGLVFGRSRSVILVLLVLQHIHDEKP
jgi:hypothetical protein